MSLKSTLSTARPNTISLRATVPEGIVAFLELQSGDKLEWKMEIMNGERVTIVRKVSSTEARRIASKYAKPKQDSEGNE